MWRPHPDRYQAHRALLNRRDQWHGWAEQVLEIITEPLWTSEAVLAEACYNLGQNTSAVRQLLEHVESGHLQVGAPLSTNVARLIELMTKYERMDVCDGSLVVLSEQFPKAKIITVDTRDFPVYPASAASPCRSSCRSNAASSGLPAEGLAKVGPGQARRPAHLNFRRLFF